MIARFARRHAGVLTPRFLASAGITPRQAQRKVTNGEWLRVHPGVYRVAATPPTFAAAATAALAALPNASLSHRSGGAVHCLDAAWEDELVELTTPVGTHHSLAGCRIHQRDLPSHHVTIRNGWRVTTVERTLIDLGAVVPSKRLRTVIEDALVARRTTFPRVESTFGELAKRGRPGIARVRRVLCDIDGSPPAESELERRFLALLRRNGLSQPLRQRVFEWQDAEKARVDFWYPAHDLIVEVDGRGFHARTAAFERDRRRDQLALMAGVRTVRFTHRQVTKERDLVVEVVRRLTSA